jgi:DNA helicase IV
MEGAVPEEQHHLDACYSLLSELESSLASRIHSVVSAPSTGTGQDILEREALVGHLVQQRRAAEAAHERLCFGRIDSAEESRYIGRIGLRSQAGEPVLLDWRAPTAAPFYQATTAQPLGVRRRRRILTRGKTVTHVEDEDFSHSDGRLSDAHATDLEATDAAMAAVEAPRAGRMADIVATIAADQDAIIRSPLNQLTVVEGGPGTGKTVVALHRAAWLLYTHRERLARDGVLIIGPSPTFLHYIDQVLPSLGETDVVLLTPGQLYPGIDARHQDEPLVARIKGDLRMTQVIARAVRNRIRVPNEDLVIELEDGSTARVTARQLKAARDGVPRNATFHAGREPFLRAVLAALAGDRARSRREDPTDPDIRADHVSDLASDACVRRTLNLMWLPITPEHLIRRLLSEADLLAAAADGILTPDEQAVLLRDRLASWTIDDVPLVDEAAEHLGPWDPLAQARLTQERDERSRELAHAQQALADTGMSAWIDAAGLVDRMAAGSLATTVAERATGDRTWVFGHIVVDEAQELSRMAWQVLARRATRKSMTVVGDLQQGRHPAAARTWADALAPIRGTLDLHRLTVTYRITRQVAEEAIRLLVLAGGQAPILHPVRDGAPVVHAACTASELPAYVLRNWSEHEGRAAVVLPDASVEGLGELLCTVNPGFGLGSNALDAPIAILTANDTKGLEFDQVFVVDPHLIAAQARLGSDIYVAATRATKVLHLVRIQDD